MKTNKKQIKTMQEEQMIIETKKIEEIKIKIENQITYLRDLKELIKEL